MALTNININDTQLEDIITTWLSDLTGLDPNRGQVRIAYGRDSYPSWGHQDTVVAYYLNPVNDLYGEDISDNYEYEPGESPLFNKSSTLTQVYDCMISIYGPQCRTLATLIRTNYLMDEKRLQLSRSGIYPVKGTPPANYVPYEFNTQWWQRADVIIRMNIHTVLTSQINPIESVNIKVTTKETGEKDVIIVS
jgi:hypothetical protein